MRRVRLLAVAACLAAVGLVSLPADARQAGQWATIKGQVVFPPDKPIPERKKVEVSQDKAHCLSKGDILDESLIVNPKSRGIKNVVVWLRPDTMNPKSAFEPGQIHPADAQRKPAEVVIDQPCCMFVHRVTLARVGDTIVVKNPAPVPHNFFWTSSNNGEDNKTVPAGQSYKMAQPLVAESGAIQYKCTIHPWMDGWVRIFDHPYAAVTDDDGKFEIKNAPAGKFRLVYWHEKVGYKGGKEGRFGDQTDVTAPTTGLKPVVFDVAPAK
jgi:plastocyanin